MRLSGASYEEVARAGGGIVSSVRSLREASEDELVRQTLPRVDALMAEGVTTVEIKSGYGLDLENEAKTLRAARRLGEERDMAIRTTFLGAHALPPEFKGDQAGYIAKVADEMLPAIAVKLHADQLSNLHGASLAAEYGALSADHLEYTDEAGAEAMAKSGTIAVILPGAFYFIRETKKPPIELFRKAGVTMAIATDSNPGTSPLTSLLLTMNMAATLFGMTVTECIAGVTREAARALGLVDEVGTLEPGKWADFAIWNIERPAELVYRMGFNPLHARVRNGH
jgi:imidazolonepropionase